MINGRDCIDLVNNNPQLVCNNRFFGKADYKAISAHCKFIN